jgi:long-chain fatty acid transport protein
MRIVNSATCVASAALYFMLGSMLCANAQGEDAAAMRVRVMHVSDVLIAWQNGMDDRSALAVQGPIPERAITPNLEFAGQVPPTDSASAGTDHWSSAFPLTRHTTLGLNAGGTPGDAPGKGNLGLNPSLAYSVNDRFAVSVGLDAAYFGSVDSQFNKGASCVGARDILPLATCADVLSYTPSNLIGERIGSARGGWGYGYNLGATLALSDATRLGMRYHSGIALDVEDETVFRTAGPQLSTDLARLTDQAVIAALGLPESFAIGASHQFNNHWSIAGDVTWVNWSQFDRLRIASGEGGQPDGTTTENWNNTYRYTLGLNYRQNDHWKYRLGAAYDQSPISSSEMNRESLIPAEDLMWLAFGIGYSPTPRLSFDVGYAYPVLMDPHLYSGLEHNIAGQFQGENDILSAQFKWRFE